jgi:hypothetical protein
VVDLKFFRGGVKKWITDHLSWNYKCTKCGALFVPEGVPAGRAPKYGQRLATWCVYNNLVCGQNMLRVRQALDDIFDLDVPQPTIFRFKSSLRETLQPIYGRILAHLLKGSLLHIDETQVKLRGCKGYVWMFASMDAVYWHARLPEADVLFAKGVGEIWRQAGYEASSRVCARRCFLYSWCRSGNPERTIGDSALLFRFPDKENFLARNYNPFGKR